MSTTTDAVDQVFKVTVDGVVYALRLVEVGARGISTISHGATALATSVLQKGAAMAGFIDGKRTGDSKVRGEVSIASMLRRGQGLAYYIIDESKVENFRQGAEKTTLLYGVTDSLQTQNGKAMREIVVPLDQAPLLNNILYLNGINVVKQVDIDQISAEPIQGQEQSTIQMPTSEEAVKEINRQKNEEFLSRIREQMRERENNFPSEDKTINPPMAARTESIDLLSEAELQTKGSRQNQQRDTGMEAEARQSIKTKIEILKREDVSQPELPEIEQKTDILNKE